MRGTLEERFWAKVRKTDGCWLWTAALSDRGYGLFAVTHRWLVRAHRVSWELAFGAVPDGLFVLHRCDVCACVNPAHLFLGTQRDNMRDKVIKGRAPVRLTKAQARRVCDLRARGWKQIAVAARFGIAQSTVSRITRGQVKSYDP